MNQRRLVAAGLGCCCLLAMGAGSARAQNDTGQFENHSDIGPVKQKGSVWYDAVSQVYTVTGSGANMWFGADEFHFVWRKISGDFVLSANAELLGDGADPHRKIGWMVRPDLAFDSPYVDVALHGDGLTSMQFRRARGENTEQVQSGVTMPSVLQLERRGGRFIMSVARTGDEFTTAELADVQLPDEVYVGLFVCAHNADAVERARFSNVRVTVPAQGPEAASAGRRDPQPQVRYENGLDSRPQDGVPRGQLEGPFLFHSKIIEDTTRQYWVFVPAQYRSEDPACVLVFQDGARAVNPNGVLRVPVVLENLIAKKQIPVTIGIFITPGHRGELYPDRIGTGNPDNRDREYDVLNDTYARFIVDEMLEVVGAKYNLSQDPAARAIGGSSSGGICAFTVAWERPDQFRNVISLIGSFTDIHGGHVYPDRVLSAEKKNIRIFLQDGVDDLRSPANLNRDWHVQNQKMVAALERKGYDVAHVFGEGGHSDDHGGAILPEMLRWIWRDYPGVVQSDEDLVAKAAALSPVHVDLFPGYDPASDVDPTGTWTWERRFGENSTTYSLTVNRDSSGGLTGAYSTVRGDQELVHSDILNPTMRGNKLIFDIEREFNGRAFSMTYQGVVHPDKIVGWTMMELNGTPRDRAWSAARR